MDLNNDGVYENYVTPVKFQNPFGTCWGFSAIAAAETSLLSSGLADKYMGKNEGESPTLNLSEKHLTYFVNQPIDDPENSQYGEGMAYFGNPTTGAKETYYGKWSKAKKAKAVK